MRRHIAPAVGNLALGDLTPRRVKEIEHGLVETGLSLSTVSLVHAVISGACRYAVQMEELDRNPATVLSAPKGQRKEARTPSMADVRQLLATAEQDGHYLFPFLHTLIHTGLRRGEAWRSVGRTYSWTRDIFG